MSRGIHFMSSNISGYGTSDRRCLPCLRVPGRAVVPSPCSCGDLSFPLIKILSLKYSANAFSGGSFTCKASSNIHRRNPDFSRQNKHGFSRNRNRQNQEREKSENFEESGVFSSKNGPLLSLSSTPKFQTTATPGPREKEIVELFRKVQAQLRERAAMKGEKKIETSKGQGRESGTVDSLLNLLRKHSVEQGKKRNSGSSGRDFAMDSPEQSNAYGEEENTTFFNSTSIARDEDQEYSTPTFTRPASNFRRRSPVPRMKYQPIYSTEESFNPVSDLKSQGKKSMAETESESEIVLEPEPETEPAFSDAHEEVYDEIIEFKPAETDEAYNDGIAEEHLSTEERDLSALKLSELRVLAKSRGIKRFSRLKKGDLVEVLRRGSL